MGNSREAAHTAMHGLWETADRTLREADDADLIVGTSLIRELETDMGAKISLIDGELSVTADFETPKGTTEIVEVTFPEDIRDLAASRVRIDWYDDLDSGTNTAPIRDFPKIARELMALV